MERMVGQNLISRQTVNCIYRKSFFISFLLDVLRSRTFQNQRQKYRYSPYWFVTQVTNL
jgi:hypothetical protein